ncbi:MAG: AIR synthase family protein [Anaerolineales bacterium]
MNPQTTSKSSTYPLGKLPQEDLVELLRHQTLDDPRVILGPGLGRDAAVITFGDRYLVAKSDPITFATAEIGWYAVHVNANDVACLGAQPRWFLATLLMPEGQTDRPLVEEIFDQIHRGCREVEAILVGGHTEITYGLERPIVVGAMFGEVLPEQLVRSDGARPGDKLILTKGIAVEGTALIARERLERLQECVGEATLARAADFLHDPGISVVRDAAIVTAAGEVHAMHDPTEGGVATGLWEMAGAAGVGAVVDEAALPLFPETEAFAAALDLDPLGLIASGALLAAVNPQDASTIIAALERAGIAGTIIGEVRAEPGIELHGANGPRPLPTFHRDEIARLFES